MRHQTPIEDKVPKDFTLCIHEQCSVAGRCLRRMAWSAVVDSEKIISAISSSYAVPGEECHYFRSAERVVYARGFCDMQARMLPGQYVAFSQKLISLFSRDCYYERRRGERLCSPNSVCSTWSSMPTKSTTILSIEDFIRCRSVVLSRRL